MMPPDPTECTSKISSGGNVYRNEDGKMRRPNIEKSYDLAREQYACLGVDTDDVIAQLSVVPVSINCWQGDDVGGFEHAGAELASGLAVTGNHPGRARTVEELRCDFDKACSLIPGQHRFNLHASYGEFDGHVDRDQIGVEHFQGWIDWAKHRSLSLDFNPTYFSHEKASDGFTLAHSDPGIRHFWIEHGVLCRRIAAAMAKAQGNPCVNNVWVPDGYKDTPADRTAPRERLAESLDALFEEVIDPELVLDAVECKLFGIGSESYVVGSHEFYLGYAISRGKVLCLDTGHFHPTEVVSDKISSVLMYVPELLLHVSRGVRWDSDHVVTFTDELQAIMHEIVRGDYLQRVHIGLDFFDASINRIAAWTIGTRNVLKALLMAMLEPTSMLQEAESDEDYTKRLAIIEEMKSMPFTAVWNQHCLQMNVPVGIDWLAEVEAYEATVLSRRSKSTVAF